MNKKSIVVIFIFFLIIQAGTFFYLNNSEKKYKHITYKITQKFNNLEYKNNILEDNILTHIAEDPH